MHLATAAEKIARTKKRHAYDAKNRKKNEAGGKMLLCKYCDSWTQDPHQLDNHQQLCKLSPEERRPMDLKRVGIISYCESVRETLEPIEYDSDEEEPDFENNCFPVSDIISGRKRKKCFTYIIGFA